MNILKISLLNIKSKPFYTFLSVFILSLSIALLLGVEQLKSSFEYQTENNLGDIDLVVGAKGSPLQLVLSSVLHLDNPTGNIPYNEATQVGKSRMIEKAVPISYGDNFKGFRIVGTTNKFLEFYEAEISEGNTADHSMEVVLGAVVAEKLQLKIGDTFQSSHGLVDNDVDVHDGELKVVGILKPTQKVIDRLIVTDLRTIWDIHNHGDHGHNEEKEEAEDHNHVDGDEHDHEHEEEIDPTYYDDKEITSLLISFRNPTAVLTFPRKINETTNMQAAMPKFELDRLYEFTGIGFKTVSAIAFLILIISGMIIFLSLYKMVKEQAFQLAIMRTYGASNMQLVKIVAYEGFMIAGMAIVFGFLMSQGGLYLMSGSLETGLAQNIIQGLPTTELLQIIGLVIIITIISVSLSIYPIIKMNISTILSDEK